MTNRIVTRYVLTALVCLATLEFAVADESIKVLPPEITLVGPRARQRLLFERVADGQWLGQVDAGVEITSSDPGIAKVQGDTAIPVSDGKTTITVRIGEKKAVASVSVTAMHETRPWEFRNHIQSVLYKSGCSTGACHGALAGKGGFKLSLRGYDPKADYYAIAHQARARRLELGDPGRSLLLAKPTAAIPHKGGLRFEVDSLEYRVFSEWVTAGAPPPRDDDPRLARLEILPAHVVLKPSAKQQMLVRAHFDNGRIEDVTHWVKFAATDEAVAKVDADGVATMLGHGEGAVTAWYLSQIVVARIAVPYENEIEPQVFAASPRRNFIDTLVLEKLADLNLKPSPRTGDSEFLRRVFLDTIGTLPTADETRAFLANTAPDKRDRLIDQLLTRPEFIDYWAYKWSDLMLVNGRRLRPAAVKAYYIWIRKQVAENTPWNELVHRVVTAKGSSLEHGETNFYALHQTPEEMTENVSQAFLGLSIGCAKCHNHPLEKWTNNQYYAMSNLFARVRAKGWGGDPRNGDGRRTLVVTSRGDLVQPLTGRPQPPAPLDAKPIALDAPQDRREYLADWLTADDNPYFSRAIANRVWANFMGVGLVESVDDMRMSNPASNEKLLAALADHVVKKRYDLKALMRTILQSETYQRTSRPLAENRDDQRFYSRYYPRRLMAEVMLDAVTQVTGVPAEFNQVLMPGADVQKTDAYPKGTRAIQLHDSAVVSYFLRTFGRNPRSITCECERSNKPNIIQILHVVNGDTINDRLSAKESQLTGLLSGELTDARIIEEAYLRGLARHPTKDEQQRLLAVFAETPEAGRRELVEDLFAAILSSREFMFNH